MKYQFPIEEQAAVHVYLVNLCKTIPLKKDQRKSVLRLKEKFKPTLGPIYLDESDRGLFLSIFGALTSGLEESFQRVLGTNPITRLYNRVAPRRRGRLVHFRKQISYLNGAFDRVADKNGTT